MRTRPTLLLAAALLAVPLATRGMTQSAPAPAGPQDEVTRRQTVEDLATQLVDRYVFPETGKKYAAMLRANAAAGKYDSLTDDAQFAKQVSADLEAVAFDGHLKLVPTPASSGGKPGGKEPQIPDTIEAQGRLTKDVAYIRIGKFFSEPEGIAGITKFLEDNRDAETIILDVRTHIGGGLDEMDAMFPYLFDKETVLVGMDSRMGVDSPLDDGPRLRKTAAPESIVRREHFVVPGHGSPLAKAKVFVLASGRTGSAGEHFVLSLKRTHRATVVGETTYGAGNFGRTEQIAGGFQAFVAVGRTFDPDTDKGWDYSGIAPNVAVPAAQALTEALVLSGVSKAEAEALSAKYGPSADAVSSLRKAPASVAGI